MYQFKNDQELKNFIEKQVLTSKETVEFLGITRQRLSTLIKNGKLFPIKKLRGESLFLKKDLEEKKYELEALRKKYRPYDSN